MQVSPFETRSPMRTYVRMAIPQILSLTLSVVYNMADTYFISAQQNTELVAGVSLCAPLFTILMAFGNIFGQGGSSLISRLYGKKEIGGTRAASAFCFYTALLTGLAAGALMLLLRGPFLRLLGADAATEPYARQYYTVIACGAPLLVANFVHMNLLRCEDMAKEAMLGSVGGLILNVILDPLFISVFGWGAFGAALASVIGYAFTVGFYLIPVLRKSRILSVRPREMKVPRSHAGQIFSVGISAAVTNWMSSISLIILNHFLLPFGNDRIAAMGIAQKSAMMVTLILTALCFSSAPVTGYFYGAGAYRKLKDFLKKLFLLVTGVGLVLGLAVILAAPNVVKLFLKDETVVRNGTEMLRWVIASLFLPAWIMLFTITFQASGHGWQALITSVCRQGIVFLAVIFVLSNLLGYRGILISQLCSDVLTVLLILPLFLKTFRRILRA